MQLKRIKRSYRHFKSPSQALSFAKKVRYALTDNANFPASAWGARLTLLQQYCEAVIRLEDAYNVAINGDRILILERDKLWAEIVLMLDEIAAHLEAESTRNPAALYSTGFDIAAERRGNSRTSLPLAAAHDFRVFNAEQQGKAIASAGRIRGAYNYEIHITDKDPSVEGNWLHKLIAHDPSRIEMDNVNAGNNFFRIRGHGPEGPGPWSPVVTITIT